MKILHYTSTYAPAWKYGGPPRSVSNLCEGLAGLGHAVTVFTTDAGLEADQALPRDVAVERNGVAVHYFRSSPSRWGIASAGLEAAIAARVGEFDLLHLCGAWQRVNPPAARAASRAGVPYVVSPRGMLQPYSFWQQPWKKWPWYLLLERRILASAAALHCTSAREADAVSRLRPAATVVTVPNAVRTDLWSYDEAAGKRWRARHSFSGDHFVILMAGRLHRQKALDLVPQILGALPAALNWRCVMAGGGDAGAVETITRQLQRERMADRVSFPGHLGTDELAGAYAGADLVLFPSREENFGNVAVEALACQCPLVVADTVGVSAELAHLPIVRTVGRAVTAWVEAIIQLSALRERGSDHAAAAEWVKVHFNPQTVGAAMLQQYEMILHRHLAPA